MRFFSHSKYFKHVTQGRKPWAAFTRFLCFQGSCLFLATSLGAQWGEPKFRQLEEILPTPNAYRTASGAPGESYWQQKADYDIKVELDDELQRIVGSEVIHYQNNSPDDLDYLWIQIDANLFAKDSDGHLTELAPDLEGLKFRSLRALLQSGIVRRARNHSQCEGCHRTDVGASGDQNHDAYRPAHPTSRRRIHAFFHSLVL